MEKKTYAKLGDLDGKSFTVEKAYGFSFKKWDEASKRMLMEKDWRAGLREEGYRKVYGVDTTAGILDVSEKQMKDMLAATYKNGIADINGRTFKVKKVVGENGIPNYYFNVDYSAAAAPSTVDKVFNVKEDEPISLDDIPF